MEKTGKIGQKLNIGQKVKIHPEGESSFHNGTGIVIGIVPVEEHSPEDLETKYILYKVNVLEHNFASAVTSGTPEFWDFELEAIK